MLVRVDVISSQDSKLFISRYKTGFYPPNDVPFEDLSNTGASQGNSNSLKVDAGPRTIGTTSSRNKKRQGLLGIFGAQKVIVYSWSLRLFSPGNAFSLSRTFLQSFELV